VIITITFSTTTHCMNATITGEDGKRASWQIRDIQLQISHRSWW